MTCISDLGYYVPRQDKFSNQNKLRLREISTSDPDRLIGHVEGFLRERWDLASSCQRAEAGHNEGVVILNEEEHHQDNEL